MTSRSEEHTDGSLRLVTEVEVGMPLMGQNNLAEGPLLQQLGHLRWQHLSRVLGVPSRDLCDVEGDRLYATFFYVEIDFPTARPMAAFGENDRLTIVSTLRQFSGFLDGEHYLVDGASGYDDAELDGGREQVLAAGIPVVRMANSFVKQWKGAGWLKPAAPTQAGFEKIPVTVEPAFFETFGSAKRGGYFLDPAPGFQPITGGVAEVEYVIVPERDVNGAGLLYFTNYPVITDVCERRIFEGLFGRDEVGEVMASRTIASRRSAYYSNASSDDTLIVGTDVWGGRVEPYGSGFRRQILCNTRMRRASDGRHMYVSSVLKWITSEDEGVLSSLSPASQRASEESSHSSTQGSVHLLGPAARSTHVPTEASTTMPSALAAYTDRAPGPEEMVDVLAAIWTEVLGREIPVDRHLITDLGVDSIDAVRAATRISEVVDTDLRPDQILNATTVLDQASQILSKTSLERTVTVLGQASPEPPLILVHPAGGHGWLYLKLLEHVRDRQLYLIGSPSWNERDLFFRDIEGVARRYLEEVKRLRPAGPYVIGGYSFGGMVAFEMGRLLEASGEEVHVVLFDTKGPSGRLSQLKTRVLAGLLQLAISYPSIGRRLPRLRAIYGIRAVGVRFILGMRPARCDNVEELMRLCRFALPDLAVPREIQASSYEAFCNWALPEVEKRLTPDELREFVPADPVDLLHQIKVRVNNEHIMRTYVPRSVARGRVSILKASDVCRPEDWAGHCALPVETHEFTLDTPGAHGEMFDSVEHVQVFGPTLARVLSDPA